MGCVLLEVLKKEEVDNVVVVEKSEDVIKLAGKYFEDDDRVEIINMDIFDWERRIVIATLEDEYFDFIWFDIWDNICSDNLEDMKKLHRKFGRLGRWKGSWERELCERMRDSGY